MTLFSFDYPTSPGFKDGDTSRAAAESVAPSAAILRSQCLAAIRKHGPLTADECAERVGISVLSARPRCTELLAMGLIADTGERRSNASGRSAKCWAAV